MKKNILRFVKKTLRLNLKKIRTILEFVKTRDKIKKEIEPIWNAYSWQWFRSTIWALIYLEYPKHEFSIEKVISPLETNSNGNIQRDCLLKQYIILFFMKVICFV